MRLALGVLIVFCGCGASAPLSQSLGGVWKGTANVNFTGGSPYAYFATVTVSVTGNSANISGVCTDGSGTVVATGSGTSALYNGTLACAPVELAGCSLALTYSSVAIRETTSGLDVLCTGTSMFCTSADTVFTDFSGTAQ